MNAIDTFAPAARAAAASPRPAGGPAAPQVDFYTAIHKALRGWMFETVQRLGRLDTDDAAAVQAAADDVLALMAQLRSHLQHENDFVHTAIEARQPGGSRHTADEHVQHLDSIAQLEDEAHALLELRANALPQARATAAMRLYRHLAVFVGENLLHMHIEETDNHAALCALYTDAELSAIHDRLLASIGPEEMVQGIRKMAAALAPQELAAMFGGMREAAPPEAFRALLDVARSAMDEPRWAQLARHLGIAPVPGLVEA